jgi:hypothetical protein
MNSKEKIARQKKAASEIAEIMLSSLQQFSKREQQARIRRIEKVEVRPQLFAKR